MAREAAFARGRVTNVYRMTSTMRCTNSTIDQEVCSVLYGEDKACLVPLPMGVNTLALDDCHNMHTMVMGTITHAATRDICHAAKHCTLPALINTHGLDRIECIGAQWINSNTADARLEAASMLAVVNAREERVK